ncbi:MAG: phosphoribosylformimino-5-aminoimidazole carboxamide ribotide isomerase [Thermoplasmata archaeon]|jgi:phosphoribosylformimino-5-aminoimidazole carboxamide ribotide isomerase|nr:phosphoribosylformimino-5-aminoimidazole carboxamide ribotide isomerase [Thermoplasmata archaeon]
MEIAALVELSGGRLPDGDRPEAAAEAARAAGAGWLHVVDVDAAQGLRNQWLAIGRLQAGPRLQFGGGVRSMTQVQQLRDLGVERVLVSTQAVRNPLWVRELCRLFTGHVVLGLDVQQGEVVTDGRRTPHGQDALEVAASLDDAGLAAFVLTDPDGTPTAEELVAFRHAAPLTPLWVVARDPDAADLAALAEAGVAGLIVAGAGLEAAAQAHPAAPRAGLVRVLRGHDEE